MHSILAVTSSVLSAAAAESGRSAQCETRLVLCVFLFHGLRYQILSLDSSAAPPAALSLQLCPHKPVCLSLWPRLWRLLLISSACYYFSIRLYVCLLYLFFFVFHLSVTSLQTCLSLSLSLSDLLLAPGRWRRQHKLSLESDHTEDDSYEKFPTLIKGLSFKHCCLRETNSYCHMKIADFPSFASLFWFLN